MTGMIMENEAVVTSVKILVAAIIRVVEEITGVEAEEEVITGAAAEEEVITEMATTGISRSVIDILQ